MELFTLMIEQPLVSVIMPFHNTPTDYLREAIESVLQQSYTHWELWLIDDGSTNGSTQLAQEYNRRQPDRIFYLDHDGHVSIGASASRQAAIDRANGRYVALLDGDDLWLPSKLAQQVDILEAQPDAAMLYGNTLYWYSWSDESTTEDFMPPLGLQPETLFPAQQLLPRYLRGTAAVPCTCSAMVRRSILEQTGGFETGYSGIYDDQIFYSKICFHGAVYVTDHCWDKYRRNPTSMTSVVSTSREFHLLRLEYLQWLCDYVSQQDTTSTDLTITIKQQIWLFAFPSWISNADKAINSLRWFKKWLLRLEALLPLALRKRLWRVGASS